MEKLLNFATPLKTNDLESRDNGGNTSLKRLKRVGKKVSSKGGKPGARQEDINEVSQGTKFIENIGKRKNKEGNARISFELTSKS